MNAGPTTEHEMSGKVKMDAPNSGDSFTASPPPYAPRDMVLMFALVLRYCCPSAGNSSL